MLYDFYQMLADAVEPCRTPPPARPSVLQAWNALFRTCRCAWGAAALEGFALFGFTHVRPDFGVDDGRGARRNLRGQRKRGADDAVLPADPLRARGRRARPEACCWSRRCPAISRRCCAAHCARCCATIRSISPTGSTRATCRSRPARSASKAYTRHLVDFIRFLGEDCHVVAVCQPTVSALAATAVLAMEGSNTQPSSLTLMAGPIDVRISPNGVNKLANDKPLAWFRDNLIATVPRKFAGGGRKVYPGFLQLSAFMSMNAARHQNAFHRLLAPSRRGPARQGRRDRRVLPRISRGDGHDGGVLSGDDRSGVPALPAAAGRD